MATIAGLADPRGAHSADRTNVKTETFDSDPQWEGYKNRTLPEDPLIVEQDFGYSATSFAGEKEGEIGGTVRRCSVPAYYVGRIPTKTLNDRLSASGTFAIKSTDGGGGVMFGWFNSENLATDPDTNSFVMQLGFENSGGRMSLRLHNSLNQVCANFVTPYIPGRYRPTPLAKDGIRYRWKLDYAPLGNNGDGQFHFTIVRADGKHVEDFEGLDFVVDLPPGFKETGATFDRFGMTNERKLGGSAEIYFDDLEYDGITEDFSSPPESWEGSCNRGAFEEPTRAGANDFGLSSDTNLAGGNPGEAGGNFWRTEGDWGYYADRIGPLTLEDRLEASGKVTMPMGGSDSDMALGWFNSASADKTPRSENFLGVLIGGPTRMGHMFSPSYTTGRGDSGKVSSAPVLAPGKSYLWNLVYDPTGNNGDGSIQVTLGDESVALDLNPGDKSEGATFDRFGLLSVAPGGSVVTVYLDDLSYTSSRKETP